MFTETYRRLTGGGQLQGHVCGTIRHIVIRTCDQLDRAAIENMVCVCEIIWKELLLVTSVQLDTGMTSSCFIVSGLCEYRSSG
jgi:hypothetical protein